jgi:hypothetical protein
VTGTQRSLLGLFAASWIVACSAQADDASTPEPGVTGAGSSGAGGAAGNGAAGAEGGGLAGSSGDAGGGGTAAAGAGGTGDEVGMGGGGTPASALPETDSAAPQCSGLYASAAPWPGEGRCGDRGGRTTQVGPRSFSKKAEVSLGTPIHTTPIIGATAVFVASVNGVYRLDLALADPPKLILAGTFASAPVLTEGMLFAVSTDGVLHFTAQEAAGIEQAGSVDLRLESDPPLDAGQPWASAPLLTDTELLVATPWGHIARVELTKADQPAVGARITTAGQLGSPHAAVVLDEAGGVYLPTNIGLFRVSRNRTQLDRLGTSAVETTPVGTGRGVIFTDSTGRMHETVALANDKPGGKDSIDDYPGAVLPAGTGAMASLGDLRFVAASDKVLRLVTVNDADKNGPVFDSTDGATFFAATGPIETSVAVDGTGVLYIASTDGNLYIVNDGGEVLDSYLTGGALVAQPSIVSGAVYLGSTDGTVYRLTGPS